MRPLPQGWVISKLGGIAGFEMGQAPPASACNLNGNGTVFVKAGEFGPKYPVVREWTTNPLKFALQGDVLMCVVGATAGKLNLGIDCAIGRSVAAIRPRLLELQSCIYNQLKLQTIALRADSTGSAQGVISKQMLADIEVFVPPLQEQKRIADKLDTVLTRVDAVNTRLSRVAPILKRFRQSVLAAATSGRLTEDWRTTRGHPQAEKTTLQSICQQHRVITYGVVKLGDETPGGTPCLRTSNVRWLRFELEGMKLIHPALSAEYKRTVLCGGEVLVNVRGTLGGVAVATSEMAGWNVSREVAVVPVDQKTADPAFIALWIASEDCQRWLTGVTKGVAYTGINIEDLRTLPLELPGKEEQAEIVRRVETLFAFADRLEARLQTAQTATERLTPALLAKAFRGELVPQDPNEEPACELLKRLANPQSFKRRTVRGRGLPPSIPEI